MSTREPGSLLLHPATLLALALLVVNDHYLKAAHPSPLTGILSDIAGLAFLPLLAVSLAEMVASRPLSAAVFAGTAVSCGIAFSLVEMTSFGDTVYEAGAGNLQLPLRVSGIIAGQGTEPVRAASDPLDLLALPAVAVGPLLAQRRNPHPGSQTPVD
jgi:hypothetical protein